MIRPRHLFVPCWVLAAACGGASPADDDDDVFDAPPGTPVRTPGGGVANPGIAGTLNVFAVDALTDAPLSGAAVRIETATALAATTGSDGLAGFADAALAGDQTITVTAAGHVATTWIGVAGHDVTIPLAPSSTTVATAHASGTIAGWNNLPAPSFGHYTLAVVLASFTDDLNGPANTITQPAPGGTPANTCLRSAISNTCAWQLEARTGRQVHFAVIVDGDPNGTTSDVSDDTYNLVGYAVGDPVDLATNQQLANQSLTIVAAGQLTDLQVNLPQPPSGLSDVIAIPVLDLGADGRIVFPLPTLTPTRRMTRVLAPTGRFAGTYDLVTLATPPGAAATPYASSFARGLTSVASVMATTWLAPPTGVTMSGRTGTFTAPASPIRYATIRSGTASRWSLSILDGSSAFTLPALAADPLPSGSLTLEITPADVPAFDAGNFRVDALRTTLARASGASVNFNH